MQNVCDDGCIKHGSDFSCVCEARHTVDPDELFAIRQNNRNGQPYQCVCDIRHTVRFDELFAKTVSQIKVCVIYGIRFTWTNCFRLGNTTEMVQLNKMCVIRDKKARRLIREQVHTG